LWCVLQPIVINLTSFSNASRESAATSAAAFVAQQLTAVFTLSSEVKPATQQQHQLEYTSNKQSPRPTNKRLTSLGIRGHMSGKEAMMSTPGPMTTDRETLELIMKAALASEPWRLDPAVTFKPWTPVTFTKPLKVAVQWWDGVVTPHPPMRRALREVAEACRKAGMKVVDWECEKLDHRKGWEIISSLYWPDGGEQVLNSLRESGEPVLPLTKFIIEDQPAVKNLSQQELWDVSI
jgi:amidase